MVNDTQEPELRDQEHGRASLVSDGKDSKLVRRADLQPKPLQDGRSKHPFQASGNAHSLYVGFAQTQRCTSGCESSENK